MKLHHRLKVEIPMTIEIHSTRLVQNEKEPGVHAVVEVETGKVWIARALLSLSLRALIGAVKYLISGKVSL